MFQVKSIMTTNVVTVKPEVTMRDAASLILRHGVSGLPVVDDEHRLVGVISEWDLLPLLGEPGIESEPIANYMTYKTLYVSEEVSLIEVVDLFQAHRVRRLPVTKDGKLVGLVSRHDLIRFILTTRDRISDRLYHDPKARKRADWLPAKSKAKSKGSELIDSPDGQIGVRTH